MSGTFARILLACLMMGLLVHALVKIDLVLAILGGMTAYAVLVFLLRIIDRAEISTIRRVLAVRKGAQAEGQAVAGGVTR
jgi:hypothetical protein